MKKIYIKLFVILLFTFFTVIPNITFAEEDPNLESIISGMSGVGEVSTKAKKTAGILNGVINLIQYAGTGISVLTVTILGIKYMIASPNEKADVKKMAMPIVIGSFILFSAANLVGIVATVGESLNK